MVSLGILLHAIGGFAAGSFYIAFRKVRNWSWESYWLVNGLFTWVIMPWTIALLTVPDLGLILSGAPVKSVFWTFFFGLMWGIGNLTFGLSLRYLGMSLGMALTLGLTTTFGTLIPPIFMGEFGALVSSSSGLTTLGGILVVLIGITVCGWAGLSKEREMSKENKQKYIREFNFRKGVVVAIFAGIISACFAFAVHAGKPIAELAGQYNTPVLWRNSAVLVLMMGDTVFLNSGSHSSFPVTIDLHSMNPVDRVEILKDGEIIHTFSPLQLDGDSIRLNDTIEAEKSCWIVARCFEFRDDANTRFAHTAPIFVAVDHQPFLMKESAVQWFIQRTDILIEKAKHSAIDPLGQEGFINEKVREESLELYQQARLEFEKRFQLCEPTQ